MKKYEKEVLQAQIDNEKAVLKQLEKNYSDALDEINSKIELLMARQDADMSHVIYQIQYQQALKTQVQAILETLQTNEFETISEYLTKSYEEGFLGAMYSMHKQGIPLIFPLDQKAVVAAIQNETKLSESLYTRLGHDIVDLRKKITGEISRGLSSGQMFSEISRNIASWARIPKSNAMRITRTEAHRIQCKATADAQHRAKEKGADVVKQWDSTLDSKTRESHVAMDGEIAELDETFSNGLEYPGDPKGSAEEVINCRCALLQRARWALGNDYTKWSEDAPVVISDDGTAQLAIIEAKNFEDFQKQYKQASERVREGAQKMNDDAKYTGKEEYELLSPQYINPVNPVTSQDKVDALTFDFESKGYDGRPIVAVDIGDGQYQALTGSHRIYAARRADIDIPVHVVKADDDTIQELLSARDDEARVAVANAGKVDKDTKTLLQKEITQNEKEADSDIWSERAKLQQKKVKEAAEEAERAAKKAAEEAKKAEEAAKEAREKSEEMKEYKDFYAKMQDKYGEHLYAEMDDAEYDKLERLERVAFNKK